jgi:hypothetical protein
VVKDGRLELDYGSEGWGFESLQARSNQDRTLTEKLQVREEPLSASNLCVYRTRFSQTEVQQLAAAVTALPLEQFGVYGISKGVGDRPVDVELLVVNEQALAVLSPIGLDKLNLQPAVRPVR